MVEVNSSVSVADLRAGISDVISRASYGHERIGITRHGKVAAVIISLEDLEKLEALEDAEDLAAYRRAKAGDDGTRVGLGDLRAEQDI